MSLMKLTYLFLMEWDKEMKDSTNTLSIMSMQLGFCLLVLHRQYIFLPNKDMRSRKPNTGFKKNCSVLRPVSVCSSGCPSTVDESIIGLHHITCCIA